MPQELLIIAALMAVVFGGPKLYARVKQGGFAISGKTVAGLGAVAIAVFLATRGRIEVAVGVGGFGLYLLGFLPNHKWAGMFHAAGGAPKTSRVTSPMIAMELDHETGSMRGEVLAGAFAGRALSDLTRPQCDALFAECARDDPEGARLLEAWLAQRFPGWRPAAEAGDDSADGARRSGAMSEDDARELLGLEKGAGREEIVAAHRNLMKKLHPDHGGTSKLAALINEAREVLLKRAG